MSTPSPFDFPVIIGENGLQPQDPTDIQTQLLANVGQISPGYTARLPGILIEDISSTDVAAIVLCDQAKVELVNSLNPNGANEFLLNQLAVVYGVPPIGQPTNTSVEVVFTGTVGYVVPNGFLVSDGTNTYQVQGGGAILTGGSSNPLTALSVQAGSFGVPVDTVTTILTSVPSTVNLTVNNPTAGTPGGTAESPYAFRARILQAGLAACVGSSRFIKTMLSLAPGVQQRLISVQAASPGLRIIVGGGDAYDVAYAIFVSVADPSALVGHAVGGSNITASLVDPPNTYNILFVNPPSQAVTMAITWNTSLSSFTGGGAFAQLVQPPLVAYINSVPVGSTINELEMFAIFQNAVAALLDPTLLTRLVFSVSINGTPTSPGSGTFAISGDAESYFLTASDGSGITVVQG
jgi:hypothetical protein